MTEPNTGSWLSWSYWRGSSPPSTSTAPPPDIAVVTVQETPVAVAPVAEPIEIEPELPLTGWKRVLRLYEEPSMEVDVVQRVARMTFFGGFLMGGATGYVQARQTYEQTHVGKKYLSPSDAFKRKIDYAIVRFAKTGFGMGFKCALISGSIVLGSTHLAAYRDSFSSWYFPAISGALASGLHSALVGGVFAFPLGLAGSVKACGLGITSGLTLAAVVHLYAMSIDKSVDQSYRIFKAEYEKELFAAAAWDQRVKEYMEQENIMWRQTAVKQLRAADDRKLTSHDA